MFQINLKTPTSEHMAIPSAIISNPASMFKIFFILPTATTRLNSDKAMPAGSFPLTEDEDEPLSENMALAFLRSPHVLRKFPKSFVGGLRSSRNLNSC